MSVEREGGCACGALRHRLASEPLFVHCCHCLNCQRQTGSAFVINLLIEAERLKVVAGAVHQVDGYYSDDDFDDEDPDELRERAFKAWRKHGARCNPRALRLAHEYADDLGFYADGRADPLGPRVAGSLVTDAARAARAGGMRGPCVSV